MMTLPPHQVEVRPGPRGSALHFAGRFNAAVAFVDRHVEQGRGSRIAIRTASGQSVTYGQLAERVSRWGRGLLELGLSPGERLLMVVADTPEFFYLFWGAVKAGIVPVPLNTLLRADDYATLIEDSGAAGVVWSPRFDEPIEAALDRSRHAPRVHQRTVEIDRRSTGLSTELDAAPSGPWDDCFWLYSSGSTGPPKGAVHAHASMVVTSQRYGVETLGMTADDVCYSAAKLFFAYGLGNAMTFPLWVGGTAILAEGKPTPAGTLEVIGTHRPTLYFGVPTLYAAQLQTLAGASLPANSLRACVSAGEALPADLWRRWEERTGLIILDGIGSTEALHIFISNRLDDVRPGTSGRPVPGYEARIVDDQGDAVAAARPGQLLIRGDSVAKRYHDRPDRTAETMVDGWLRTGDTYTRDEAGYYTYGGRTDDMLKVGGIWCSPFEIESRLAEHPAVLEAAVVGRADEHGLIKPEAWVILADGAEASAHLETSLREHCRAGLAPYKYPRWFRFVETLPKTATGKIRRFVLRART